MYVCCAYEAENEHRCFDGVQNKKLRGQKGEMDDGRISEALGWRRGRGGSVRDGEAGARLQLAADTVQVAYSSAEGEPHSSSDAGRASLH